MVIVVIHKNNFAFEWTISDRCYLEEFCEGPAHFEEFECCGPDGTNPNNYVSGESIFDLCYPVVCT